MNVKLIRKNNVQKIVPYFSVLIHVEICRQTKLHIRKLVAGLVLGMTIPDGRVSYSWEWNQ